MSLLKASRIGMGVKINSLQRVGEDTPALAYAGESSILRVVKTRNS